MIRPVIPTVIALLLLVGCSTVQTSSRRHPTRSYNYNAPSEKQVNRRAAELQKHGYTQEGALQKAKTEFASKAWQPDGPSSAESWADEKAREARSAANEKMEKDLAKLDRY